jgi:regulator of RNase E activity RraA
VAPDYAHGLAALVGADLFMLAALLSRRVGRRGLRYISAVGVVKLALVAGDELTAPQFGLGYAEFASYLFSLWAYDLLIVSQVGVAASIFDHCYPGCVVVVAAGGNKSAACWGELMSNAARGRGAAGAVTDGAIRDVPKILEISPPFQVFAADSTPADSKGRVEFSATQLEVVCGGVRVNPGDLVFGDYDGVVVIPKQVAEEAVRLAEEKVSRETNFREAIRRGEDFRRAVEKYRVV